MSGTRFMSVLTASLLLSACAEQPVVSDQWISWVCDNHTEVLWRPAGEDAIDLRLGGSDIAHRLKRQPAASGELYSDPILAFHTKGEEGLVYRIGSEQVVGRNCKAR
ncbi:MliC family protein [Pseudomonas sp. BMS12]|uniref:MliC family protein n=1 Tax=Pseudomonas sp. BMS12 TaxID=1796033 RepID=UPI00083B9BB6|nr:MliC family protein [Pseudomonas sp. BMS12]